MEEVLCQAQEAATAATQECATLAAAVSAMTEQDARARSSLAHRAHALRQQLLQTNAALRTLNDTERKQSNRVGDGRRVRRCMAAWRVWQPAHTVQSVPAAPGRMQKEAVLRARECTLAAEHAELLQQQAAHQARDAALETITLKYSAAAQRLKQ